MLYGIIRLFFGLILIVGAIFIIKKIDISRKKLVSIVFAILIMTLASLSALFPFENLFVNFSSPQKAFQYSMTGSIQDIVEGEKTTMILFNTGDASSIAVLPKNDQGWKIGTYFSYETYFSRTTKKYNIDIYKAKNENDYYVIICEPFTTDIVDIADNRNSSFKYLKGNNGGTNTFNVTYYTYVNNIDEKYEINIRGEVYYIR